MVKAKKIMVPLLAAVLTAGLSAGGTIAYFSYRNAVANRLSVGTNTIEISEDFTPPKVMNAGENTYKKTVKVKNTGTVPCFVRIYTAFSDSAVTEKSELSPDGTNFYPAAEYDKHLSDGWIYISEDENALLGGYYYWTGELPVKKETDPLFKMVKTTFPTAESVQDYEIIVYAESVQVLDKDGNKFAGADPWKQAWQEFLERK